MQHKKSFFIVFLRVKKNWGLKGVFPKKILKKKQKNGDFMFLCFFILSFSLFSFYPFFCFFRLRRPERVDPVELTWLGLTRSSQLKTNRRKETRNKTNQKWKKNTKTRKFFNKKRIKTKHMNVLCLLTKCDFQSRADFEQRRGCFCL